MTARATPILPAARALVARGWCQHAPARDRSGDACRPEEARAAAWSPIGAVMAVATSQGLTWGEGRADTAVQALARAIETKSKANAYHALADWNDAEGRTQRDALELFDRVASPRRAARVA